MLASRIALGFVLLLLCWSIGCQPTSNTGTPQTVSNAVIQAERAKYLLADAPADALGVKEAKEAVKESTDLVLTGTIDAGEREPWEEGKALFLVTESTIGDHDHSGADHDNCPFCNREKANNLALIKFVGEDGDTVPIDARHLFGLEKGQQVVVKGTAEVDPIGTLIVTATGIYVEG